MTANLPAWISLFPVLLLWATVLGTGCQADTTGLQTLSVAQLAAIGVENVALFDANDDATRDRRGVIPGATLLSSYRDFAASELPTDRARQTVFYCYSSMCSAAAQAARRAVALGWRNVWVMTDGLRGWTEAGLPVGRPMLAATP